MTDHLKPNRAVQLAITIGADNFEEALRELRFAQQTLLERGERAGEMHSVCPSGSFNVSIALHPEMTHDRYFQELDAYIAQHDEAEDGNGKNTR